MARPYLRRPRLPQPGQTIGVPRPTVQDPIGPPGGNNGGGGSPYDLVGFPPTGTYDPAYAQQARASERGWLDLKEDTRIAGQRARQDYGQSRRDIRVGARRERQDFATDFHRGMQKLRYSKTDTRTKAARGRQDFGFKLRELKRRFTTLGGEQGQAANQAGVMDGGTLAEAAQRRAANFRIAREPLDVGLARLNQDTATSLGRLSTSQRQARQDVRRAQRRLTTDTRRDKRLARQDFRRGAQDRRIERRRGKREYLISQADFGESARFDAYTRHPGQFGKKYVKTGRKKGKKK
jgi:hypothetical protein